MSTTPLEETEGFDPDYGELRQTFATTDLPRHLALFYRSREAQLTVAAAFVADGVARNERCLYLADDNDEATVVEAFDGHGIDIESWLADGRLEIIEAEHVYTTGGFDPDRAVARLEEHATESVDEGYAGFRVVGENTWSFDAAETFDSVIDFEVAFDEACDDIPVTALCQYDVEQFDDETIGKALQTHEQIIYGGTLTTNPYYVPPAEYRRSGAPKGNAELLLEQTQAITRFRREIEQREQRLSVINRVLRHNIRNELNVVLGRLEWLRDQNQVSDAGAEHVSTIETVTERLLELSEQARHVDQTLSRRPSRDRESLATAVAGAIEAVEREYGLSVDVDGTLPEAAHVDTAFETALEELLSLVTEQDVSETPTLTTACETSPGIATLRLRAADLLPESAVVAIERESEETLRHSLGLRIWVVRWIVESMNGTVSVETDESETALVLTVPTIPSADAA